ncbi:general secretion pathway protein GspJ [Stenotrophomonas panacihumi]|uniref:General secretion pathway protein GspJ n=1 Tax=Stenotrophomonas panacihumi TaxID=676599 RepID=A0A0R0AW66_9GAMM|nr:type II secretion system protein J [Stenotrophomonas panacihumi]KRG45553.1 general secretion pathway protein GspJ [Stenotrophomonas panacihumi]PTN55310.1 prepilin-type N-terminal cleavage/methylation domain-containing protein [Stenotrophomonas panacihumi]
MSVRRAAGFTLIEVLLATVLLAAGLTLAFATLRSAGTIGGRGEAIAARSERMRTVEGFLRQRLSAALPVVMARDPSTKQPQRFIGEAQRMRFVADVPDYLGYGGPYLHDVGVEGQGAARHLRIQLTQVQAGETLTPAKPVPAEPLADGLVEVRFSYRGFDPRERRMGDWQAQWPDSDRLPRWVRIELRDAQGDWPALLVALPQATTERTSL